MQKFEFLLGTWNLKYKIPKSIFSEARTDSGTGTIRRALNDQCVFFDYKTKSGGAAHGIFYRETKANLYKYRWFENSGAFGTATCNFLDDKTLYLNWHNTLLVQTFEKKNKNKLILTMKHPTPGGKYDIIMEVVFTRMKKR